MNDLLQWVAVGLVLVFTIVWIIRRVRKKDPGSPCDSCAACSRCDLSSRKRADFCAAVKSNEKKHDTESIRNSKSHRH